MLLLMDTWSAACCWFRLDELHDGLAGLGQTLLDPGERQGQRGAPALQAPGQLGHEGADHRRVGAHHVGDHQDQAARVVPTVWIRRSAQVPASSRSTQPAATRTLTRRRFSITASRSMMGIAYSSPSSRGVTVQGGHEAG